jgi:hypothetical protein
MFTIMWNPHWFHVIDRLPIGAKINSTYYATKILQPLYQAFVPHVRNPHGKWLFVRIDNCPVHRSVATESLMKTRDMVSMPHLRYLPNLAPNDFS